MTPESMTEQFTKLGQETADNYWKAVDHISGTTDKMTESFFASFPGLPEESTQWLSNWKDKREQGLAGFKQMMNNTPGSTAASKTPQEYAQKALDGYKENVDRLFEQINSVQTKGKETVDQITTHLPEPGKQWANQCSEMADKGVEGLKSLFLRNIDMANRFASGDAKASADSPKSKKEAGKTAGKTATK